ncbi:hypothetical protein HKCCE3408_18520 [Rhodobacterales bacterium HKCCE3408]|nr:hypothetical protein [Rhodobacterales bacterium HKCCE3408]
MKRFAPLALVAALTALPAAAQDDESPYRDGLELFGEGARSILEGLREDLGPMLDDMRPFFEEEMLPFIARLGELIDDIAAYEMPERLPNGDIIIRRSPDAPPPPPIGENGEVEL